jgi:hypothetical protein
MLFRAPLALLFVTCSSFGAGPAPRQAMLPHHFEASALHVRIFAVVPIIGSGKRGDPIRPPTSGPGVDLRNHHFTWAQDPAGNSYIGAAATTLDPGTAYQQTTTTTQTLDKYGNVTQNQIYDLAIPPLPPGLTPTRI